MGYVSTPHSSFPLTLNSHNSGGQTSIRASWSQYFASARAVILVVDSTDSQRLQLNKEELHRICADEVGCFHMPPSDAKTNCLDPRH